MSNKKAVYLFFGDDTYSAHNKMMFWRTEFEKKHGGNTNIEVLEGKTLLANNFRSNIQSAPFLADKRLVIIKDFLSKGNKDEQKKVADILETDLSNFCVILFIEYGSPDKRMALYKKINKVGHPEEFKALMGPELTKWIQKHSQEINLILTPQIASYIGEQAGSDLWNLSNELEKLKTYGLENEITKNVIDDLVHPNLTTSIFKLTDYLAHRNAKDSLKTLDILLESGEDMMKIIFMIVRHFRILIQVKDLMNRGNSKREIIGKIKEHPYTISTAMQQSPNFSLDALCKIYEALLQIDIGIKTGKIRMLTDDKKEMLLTLEKFVLNVCEIA
ncbi:DNA polymerase III subunit delta [bacterium]|nr:DNA polymerase III subunit delta [bacterium]